MMMATQPGATTDAATGGSAPPVLPFPRGAGVEMLYNGSVITPSCSARLSAKSVGP